MSFKRTVGILGGMGPLATADIFTKIINNTDAKTDQEHIPIVIDNNTNIADRTAYILGDGENPLPELIRSAKRLENMGADVIIIPCNTAHYFVKDIEKEIGIPIIKITDAVMHAINRRYSGAKRIAVISTVGTTVAGVYKEPLEDANYDVVEFSERLSKDIMSCIYDGVKSGKVDEYLPLFQTCIDEIAEMGSDVMISACTEIPILIERTVPVIPTIDATLELALNAIEFSRSGTIAGSR